LLAAEIAKFKAKLYRVVLFLLEAFDEAISSRLSINKEQSVFS